jgi:hypothetical protein
MEQKDNNNNIEEVQRTKTIIFREIKIPKKKLFLKRANRSS